jgi:hypothetical protein
MNKIAPRPSPNSRRSLAAAKAILPRGTSGWRQACDIEWLRKDGRSETNNAGVASTPDRPGEAGSNGPKFAARQFFISTGTGPAAHSFHSALIGANGKRDHAR